MAITSLDILNLSHSLKDICEVNCNTPECLSQALKLLMQYNLIQANLQFSQQFGPPCIPTVCPSAQVMSTQAVPSSGLVSPAGCGSAQAPRTTHTSVSNAFESDAASTASDISVPTVFESAKIPKNPDTSAPAQNADTLSQRPSIRLDIGDPFLADYEK